jgi:hypothetical protein
MTMSQMEATVLAGFQKYILTFLRISLQLIWLGYDSNDLG